MDELSRNLTTSIDQSWCIIASDRDSFQTAFLLYHDYLTRAQFTALDDAFNDSNSIALPNTFPIYKRAPVRMWDYRTLLLYPKVQCKTNSLTRSIFPNRTPIGRAYSKVNFNMLICKSTGQFLLPPSYVILNDVTHHRKAQPFKLRLKIRTINIVDLTYILPAILYIFVSHFPAPICKLLNICTTTTIIPHC